MVLEAATSASSNPTASPEDGTRGGAVSRHPLQEEPSRRWEPGRQGASPAWHRGGHGDFRAPPWEQAPGIAPGAGSSRPVPHASCFPRSHASAAAASAVPYIPGATASLPAQPRSRPRGPHPAHGQDASPGQGFWVMPGGCDPGHPPLQDVSLVRAFGWLRLWKVAATGSAVAPWLLGGENGSHECEPQHRGSCTGPCADGHPMGTAVAAAQARPGRLRQEPSPHK